MALLDSGSALEDGDGVRQTMVPRLTSVVANNFKVTLIAHVWD